MGDKVNYWVVSHDADTTETGLPMRRTYIKTTWIGSERSRGFTEGMVRDFCFERFGETTVYVQGISSTPGWLLRLTGEEVFLAAQPIRWGGRPTTTMRLEIELGPYTDDIKVMDERTAK